MKPLNFFLVFTLFFLQNLKSQDSLHLNPEKLSPPVYFVKVVLPGGQSFGASLMNIKDSSIYVFSKKTAKPDPFLSINKNIPSTWDTYNYKFITSIKIRNKTLRSWLIPASIVAGAIVGGIIGKNSQNQNDFGASSTAAAILGIFLGGAAGAITSLVICNVSEKKYMINGEWKNLEELKRDLKY